MVQDGDVVEIDYVGRISNTGEIFDLTSKEVAEEEGMNVDVDPARVLIGAGHVIPGLEDALRDMDVGEQRDVEVSAADGFGERDSDNIETISQREFNDHDVTPQRGLVVEIDGRRGKILSTSGGRVRVDFNHPLAGKDLAYDVTVREVLDDVQDRVDAVLTYYELEDRVTATVEDSEVTVELPEELENDEVEDLLREELEMVNGVDAVSFQ